MLILPQSVFEARLRVARELDEGIVPRETLYRGILELDPYDYVALIGLADLLSDAGDTAGAEEYLWRTIEYHPCVDAPYLKLAAIYKNDSERDPLAIALTEMGISRQPAEERARLWEKSAVANNEVDGVIRDYVDHLTDEEKGRFFTAAIRKSREGESPEVTSRMRHLRLLQEVEEEDVMERATIDAIIADGSAMAPLLVGVMRDWAQDIVQSESAVENALALLGETGTVDHIPALLEFIDLEDETASDAACWAIGRIVRRHPEAAFAFFRSAESALPNPQRLEIARQIMDFPDFDPDLILLESLTHGLASMEIAERDAYFSLLLVTVAGTHGRRGRKIAQAALNREGRLLSPKTRRECVELLNLLPAGEPSGEREPLWPFTVYQICTGEADWTADDGSDDEGDLDDEDLSAPQPVRRPATPGRNEPCWCGSGKKYKKCHLDSDEGAPDTRLPPAVIAGQEFQQLRKEIGQFFGYVMPKHEIKRGLQQFFGDTQVLEENAQIESTDWLLHDWVSPHLGRTVMEEFKERRGNRLTFGEFEMVESWCESYVGLYEVQSVQAGKGFTLKDLLAGDETFFVHEVSMSTRLSKWDGLLARVVPGERGTELAGVGLTVPRSSLEPLREWLEEARAQANLEWQEYLKENWPKVRRKTFEFAEARLDNLRIANSDGEELLFSKAHYVVTDAPKLVRALKKCRELEVESATDVFVWLNEDRTVLGRIGIRGDELTLECNSESRLKRGKQLLTKLAGNAVSHVRDAFTTTAELRKRPKAAKDDQAESPQESIPEEIRKELVGNLLRKHYEAWPDMPLPALDGKTSREAVKTSDGRKCVLEVLKEIENGEEHKRSSGLESYDVSLIRRQLGLLEF